MTYLGLTLPSLRDDPAAAIEVARVAEQAGVDGVFAFEHVWRGPSRRPALDPWVLLGAIAAETSSITLGTLVARASLRPAAVLATQYDTLRTIAGDRLVATIGAGDSESAAENESYGIAFGTLDERVSQLSAAVTACRGRGYPVWVGGTHQRVLEVARTSDGWNRWGGDAATFAKGFATVTADAPVGFTCSWGGLVVLGADEHDAEAKRERLDPNPDAIVGGPERVAEALGSYAQAGAQWLILGPVDSADPANAEILGGAVRPLLD